MTARSVATTDTLETFRTTFNSLSSTDIGDPASLTTSASSIVGAINEINTTVAAGFTGFTISDSASTQTQSIGNNENVTFASGSNITVAISAQDTVTTTLNSTITGLTSLDATTLTEGSVRVATRPFAIAQAVALG